MNWLVAPTLIIALFLFFVGQRSAQCCRTWMSRTGLAALYFFIGLPGFLFSLYYFHWFDHAEWFYEFRSLPMTELTACGAGLLVGFLAELFKEAEVPSRFFLIVLLCLGIMIPYLKPLISPLDFSRFVERWEKGVCLQSTPSSCGPASAATIFKSFGIDVTEREIAKECFSSEGGTENWYLTRDFPLCH
ncbi:MAG: hypothetical protein OEL75_00050, partial [Kiritimatiellaceae bacterium]|nr:hypothetical protein [Kiritimatiellaceae bacterium]